MLPLEIEFFQDLAGLGEDDNWARCENPYSVCSDVTAVSEEDGAAIISLEIIPYFLHRCEKARIPEWQQRIV